MGRTYTGFIHPGLDILDALFVEFFQIKAQRILAKKPVRHIISLFIRIGAPPGRVPAGAMVEGSKAL